MSDRQENTGRGEQENPAGSDPPPYAGEEGTWLSPDDDDPARDETAELARRAVRPGEPRE